jgi:hypothetical protein
MSVGWGSIAMLSMALQEGFGASSKLIFVVGDGGPTKFICQEEQVLCDRVNEGGKSNLVCRCSGISDLFNMSSHVEPKRPRVNWWLQQSERCGMPIGVYERADGGMTTFPAYTVLDLV